MFTSDVPLECNLRVLMNFTQQGWIFIYSLFLSIIDKNKKKILENPLVGNAFNSFQSEYSWSPIKAIKKVLNKDKFIKSTIAKYWTDILKHANSFNLNPIYINFLYEHYDPIKKEFKDVTVNLPKLRL